MPGVRAEAASQVARVVTPRHLPEAASAIGRCNVPWAPLLGHLWQRATVAPDRNASAAISFSNHRRR